MTDLYHGTLPRFAARKGMGGRSMILKLHVDETSPDLRHCAVSEREPPQLNPWLNRPCNRQSRPAPTRPARRRGALHAKLKRAGPSGSAHRRGHPPRTGPAGRGLGGGPRDAPAGAGVTGAAAGGRAVIAERDDDRTDRSSPAAGGTAVRARPPAPFPQLSLNAPALDSYRDTETTATYSTLFTVTTTRHTTGGYYYSVRTYPARPGTSTAYDEVAGRQLKFTNARGGGSR